MLGLMYLGAAILYLALMFFVVRAAWHAGRAKGGSIGKGVGFALLAFLAVYMPVFWSFLPTVLVHQQLCARDAGFRAVIAADQWLEANHDQVMQRRELNASDLVRLPDTADGYERMAMLRGAIFSDFKATKISKYGVTLTRLEWRKVDASTNRTLAVAVDYTTGAPEDARVWLVRGSCFPEGGSPLNALQGYTSLMERLK